MAGTRCAGKRAIRRNLQPCRSGYLAEGQRRQIHGIRVHDIRRKADSPIGATREAQRSLNSRGGEPWGRVVQQRVGINTARAIGQDAAGNLARAVDGCWVTLPLPCHRAMVPAAALLVAHLDVVLLPAHQRLPRTRSVRRPLLGVPPSRVRHDGHSSSNRVVRAQEKLRRVIRNQVEPVVARSGRRDPTRPALAVAVAKVIRREARQWPALVGLIREFGVRGQVAHRRAPDARVHLLPKRAGHGQSDIHDGNAGLLGRDRSREGGERAVVLGVRAGPDVIEDKRGAVGSLNALSIASPLEDGRRRARGRDAQRDVRAQRRPHGRWMSQERHGGGSHNRMREEVAGDDDGLGPVDGPCDGKVVAPSILLVQRLEPNGLAFIQQVFARSLGRGNVEHSPITRARVERRDHGSLGAVQAVGVDPKLRPVRRIDIEAVCPGHRRHDHAAEAAAVSVARPVALALLHRVMLIREVGELPVRHQGIDVGARDVLVHVVVGRPRDMALRNRQRLDDDIDGFFQDVGAACDRELDAIGTVRGERDLIVCKGHVAQAGDLAPLDLVVRGAELDAVAVEHGEGHGHRPGIRLEVTGFILRPAQVGVVEARKDAAAIQAGQQAEAPVQHRTGQGHVHGHRHVLAEVVVVHIARPEVEEALVLVAAQGMEEAPVVQGESLLAITQEWDGERLHPLRAHAIGMGVLHVHVVPRDEQLHAVEAVDVIRRQLPAVLLVHHHGHDRGRRLAHGLPRVPALELVANMAVMQVARRAISSIAIAAQVPVHQELLLDRVVVELLAGLHDLDAVKLASRALKHGLEFLLRVPEVVAVDRPHRHVRTRATCKGHAHEPVPAADVDAASPTEMDVIARHAAVARHAGDGRARRRVAARPEQAGLLPPLDVVGCQLRAALHRRTHLRHDGRVIRVLGALVVLGEEHEPVSQLPVAGSALEVGVPRSVVEPVLVRRIVLAVHPADHKVTDPVDRRTVRLRPRGLVPVWVPQQAQAHPAREIALVPVPAHHRIVHVRDGRLVGDVVLRAGDGKCRSKGAYRVQLHRHLKPSYPGANEMKRQLAVRSLRAVHGETQLLRHAMVPALHDPVRRLPSLREVLPKHAQDHVSRLQSCRRPRAPRLDRDHPRERGLVGDAVLSPDGTHGIIPRFLGVGCVREQRVRIALRHGAWNDEQEEGGEQQPWGTARDGGR